MHWFIEQLGALTRGGELLPHAAQHLHPARRTDPRPAGVVEVPERDDRAAGATRPRSCTACITGRCGAPTGCSRCSARAATRYRYINDQTLRLANHGYTPVEIAEQVELPARARPPLGAARLLRLGQPQRQGDLRQVPGLVRRQPGQPPHPARPRRPPSATSSSWAAPTRRDEGARRVRAGRLPLGRRGRQPRRVRRPEQPGGARAAGRRARADRLPVRGRAPGATSTSPAPRSCATASPKLPTPNTASPDTRPGDEPRPVLQLPRRPPQRSERGRQDADASTSTFTDTGEQAVLRARQRRAEPRARPHTEEDADADRHAHTRRARPGHRRRPQPRRRDRSSGEITVEPERRCRWTSCVSLLDTFEFWFTIVEP